MNLHTRVIPFHSLREEYKDKIDGQRAVLLVDENGKDRGELVWRIASDHTVEICEFGILNKDDRRQGWGTRLLNEGLEDMREYFRHHLHHKHPLHHVWLLTEGRNGDARAFYGARGFREEAVLKDFYEEGEAILCVMNVQ